jgi:hypothetical protein
MTDPEKSGSQPSEAERRKARLAKQLRDNLKRRKAQTRGRRDEAVDPSMPDAPEG